MKDQEIERLIKKYYQGETTLEEEQHLYAHSEHTETSLDRWSTFVKKNAVTIPDHLNDTLWERFEAKTTNSRRRWISSITAAASVLLLISLFVDFLKEDKLTYAQKESLLNEALNMFPDEEISETQQDIIYENEMIILYTTTE